MWPSIKVYTLMYTLRPLSGEWQRARRVGNATGRGLDECATWQGPVWTEKARGSGRTLRRRERCRSGNL